MFRPVTPANISIDAYLVKWGKDDYGNSTLVPLLGEELRKANQALYVKIVGFVEASANNQTNNAVEARFNCMTYVPVGTNFVKPPDIVTLRSVKNGISNEDFYARSRKGEIVVSDYERGTIRVRQTPGLITSTPVYETQDISAQKALLLGLIEEKMIGSNIRPCIAGTEYVFWGSMENSLFRYKLEHFSVYEWGFDPYLDPGLILTACRNHNPDFRSLITKILAKANRSSVDVLTALAEMPKSIISVIQGFKLVAGILKDAKKGQFNLDKAHELRKKQMDAKYKKRIARLQSEIRSPRTSEKRRIALAKHMDESRIKYRDTLKRSVEDLASESASLWLNYRYNIMPNVYLAQDVFDAVTKFSNEFITARGKEGSSLPLRVGDKSINVDCTLRCMIKRSFSPAAILKGQGVISNDIFVTAWELVPLSFVYDWFINFGDLLQAQMYSNKWAQEGATKSVTIEFDLWYPFEDDIAWTIEPTTQVDGKYHKRTVINPIDECGLVWQPSLGLERKIDLIALAWRPVRSLLLKGKHR